MTQLKSFEFITPLVLVFNKIKIEDKTKYDNFYSSSKEEIISNERAIHDAFQLIYTITITNKQKSLEKGSCWIIDLIIDHTISSSKYNPIAASSYIRLPKELDHLRKGLINIHDNEYTDDVEFFKSCLVRYLNPAGITKVDKDFAKTLDFKDINFQVKIRDIHKI